MKTFLVTLLCASGLAATTVHAGDNAARDMLIGGIAGALIGENNHHHAAEGAVIGAAAGLLWNGLTDRDDDCRVEYREPCREPARVDYRDDDCGSSRIVVGVPAYYERRSHRFDRDDYRHGHGGRVVVERRIVVRERDRDCRSERAYESAPRETHRRVICIREPGCAPRYVEVRD